MLFHSFFDEFNSAFQGLNHGEFPSLNVYKGDETVTVTAEVPGVHPENIDISVKENVLTLSGKRNLEPKGENVTVFSNEIAEGEFERRVRLPFAVEADKVTAEVKNGILTLTLGIAETAKAKKITVKAQS